MATLSAPKASRTQLVLRAEATSGVDPMAGTYTVGDIIPIEAESLSFTDDSTVIENRMTAGLMGRAPSIIGRLVGMLDASLLWRGTVPTVYSASVKPEIDMLMRAAGHSAVFDTSGGAKWTFKPTEVDETFTAYGVVPMGSGASALAFCLVGAQIARMTMETVAGVGLRIRVSIMGALEGTNGRRDVTYVAGSLSSVVPPVTKSAAFVIDDGAGYAPRIKGLSYDIGGDVRYVDSINAAGSVAGTLRMDRSPKLTINPEADLEANSGWWAMIRDAGPFNFCTFQIGTVQYNRLKFKFGANGTDRLLQLVKQGLTVEDGLMRLPTTLQPTITGQGNDYSIVAD